MSLESILEVAAGRELLPTSLSTSGLRREIAADIRSRSLFSARTTSPQYMARVADVLDRLGGGEINMATAKMELQQELDALGYTPEKGFGDDPSIPPAERGSLQDLSSDRRIELMLRTQEELMFGAGQKLAGGERIADYPAWELVRFKVPKGDPRDWPDRWEQVGGELRDGGRMIALKSDPIWAALGSSQTFDDALDTDHPPFAFNSGMRWKELDWYEVERFDLGEPGEVPVSPMNEDLAVSVRDIPPDLVSEIERELPVKIEARKARYQASLDRARDAYLAKNAAAAKAYGHIKNRIIVALAILNSGNRPGAFKGWETRRANGIAGSAVRERKIKKAIGEAHAEIEKGRRQGGSYEGTMHVPGTGDVRLAYGTGGEWNPKEKDSHWDGRGLKKIREKHGREALRDIPEVLLRGKSGPWQQSGMFKKRKYAFEGKQVVLSRRVGGPIVLTSFDKEAPELKKSDLKRRLENKKPASLLVNRFYEEDGNGVANPCPTRAGLVCGLPDAGASKTFNFTRKVAEVKP